MNSSSSQFSYRDVLLQLFCLVLACERTHEGRNLLVVLLGEVHTAFVVSHGLNRLFDGFHGAIVEIGSGEGQIAQAGNLEAVSVIFVFGLLEAVVVLLGHFQASLLEVVVETTHVLVGLPTQCLTSMTGGATIFLEQVVTLNLLS